MWLPLPGSGWAGRRTHHRHPSGNIVKNVKSVVIPNSGGMVGIEAAAAMGALAGDCDRELMVISD